MTHSSLWSRGLSIYPRCKWCLLFQSNRTMQRLLLKPRIKQRSEIRDEVHSTQSLSYTRALHRLLNTNKSTAHSSHAVSHRQPYSIHSGVCVCLPVSLSDCWPGQLTLSSFGSTSLTRLSAPDADKVCCGRQLSPSSPRSVPSRPALLHLVRFRRLRALSARRAMVHWTESSWMSSNGHRFPPSEQTHIGYTLRGMPSDGQTCPLV